MPRAVDGIGIGQGVLPVNNDAQAIAGGERIGLRGIFREIARLIARPRRATGERQGAQTECKKLTPHGLIPVPLVEPRLDDRFLVRHG